MGASGVQFQSGCAGPKVTIPLADVAHVDFNDVCTPPRLQSSSSPSTAACPGAKIPVFGVTARAQTGANAYLEVLDLKYDYQGQLRVKLPDGTWIETSASSITSLWYGFECVPLKIKNGAWNAVYKKSTVQQ